MRDESVWAPSVTRSARRFPVVDVSVPLWWREVLAKSTRLASSYPCQHPPQIHKCLRLGSPRAPLMGLIGKETDLDRQRK